ncbi:MAG TPA: MerR family transcriptional regulator [Acidimicrobiales bacterium]|nr:MerR family transcriptional regulator [Acidimicrobiales bacterium]
MPFELHDDTPFFTVGQVAELLGVAPAWLRRLDAESVVRPSRTEGGQRRYSRAEVGRAERVVELTGEGLTLGGVTRILALEAEVAALCARLAEVEAAGGPATPAGEAS